MNGREELEALIMNAPKPRGEGAWAWIKYHWVRWGNFGECICHYPGCITKTYWAHIRYCPRHRPVDNPVENLGITPATDAAVVHTPLGKTSDA